MFVLFQCFVLFVCVCFVVFEFVFSSYVYICMHVCVSMCVCVCLYVCMSVCLYVYVYVRMCVCVCMHVYLSGGLGVQHPPLISTQIFP